MFGDDESLEELGGSSDDADVSSTDDEDLSPARARSRGAMSLILRRGLPRVARPATPPTNDTPEIIPDSPPPISLPSRDIDTPTTAVTFTGDNGYDPHVPRPAYEALVHRVQTLEQSLGTANRELRGYAARVDELETTTAKLQQAVKDRDTQLLRMETERSQMCHPMAPVIVSAKRTSQRTLSSKKPFLDEQYPDDFQAEEVVAPIPMTMVSLPRLPSIGDRGQRSQTSLGFSSFGHT